MLCHFIFYFFLNFLYFCPFSDSFFPVFSSSVTTWGRNSLPDPLPFFLWNRVCPFPFVDKAKNFQEERAFTQNKGSGGLLGNLSQFCPHHLWQRYMGWERAQRPQQDTELQSQRSWARDRGSFLSRDRHMLSSPIILLFKNNFKNWNEFWPHFLPSFLSLQGN